MPPPCIEYVILLLGSFAFGIVAGLYVASLSARKRPGAVLGIVLGTPLSLPAGIVTGMICWTASEDWDLPDLIYLNWGPLCGSFFGTLAISIFARILAVAVAEKRSSRASKSETDVKEANTTETSRLASASNGVKTTLLVGMIAYTVALTIYAAGRTTNQRPYPVTADGLHHLRELQNLRSLRLDGCEVSDAGLELIAEFPELESLRLRDGTMTDTGLANLYGLTNLRELNLQDCIAIGDNGVAHLRLLPSPTALALSGTKITDEGLKHLSQMTRLKTLQIDGTQVTDAGMAYSSKLTELRFLDISNTAITELGRRNLRHAPNLRDVRAEESGSGQIALERFKK
jgi:hypothetical protein